MSVIATVTIAQAIRALPFVLICLSIYPTVMAWRYYVTEPRIRRAMKVREYERQHNIVRSPPPYIYGPSGGTNNLLNPAYIEWIAKHGGRSVPSPDADGYDGFL